MARGTEAAILTTAAAAGGVCTRRELAAAGVTQSSITARVSAGSLVRLAEGVFEVPALTTDDTPLHRAVKANPGSALSHHTAGHLWGFPLPPAGSTAPVEVIVGFAANGRCDLPGIVVHRARRWSSSDITAARSGLPVTTPARTIVDLAGTDIGHQRLRHLVQVASVEDRCSLGDVADCLQRVGGRGVAGSGRLRRLLLDLGGPEPLPQSELERRLGGLLDSRFDRQFRPPWYDGASGIVDLAEASSRTIIEADGRRWHATEQAMVEDRRRDRTAAANGWLVVRVTWDDVVNRPEATATEIQAAVARRSRSAA